MTLAYQGLREPHEPERNPGQVHGQVRFINYSAEVDSEDHAPSRDQEPSDSGILASKMNARLGLRVGDSELSERGTQMSNELPLECDGAPSMRG